MNSRTIIRELSEDITLTLMNDDEYSNICTEAKSILDQDSTCKKYYSNSLTNLAPFFADLPMKSSKEKPKDKTNNRRYTQFRFLVNDFSVALEQSYFDYLSEDLLGAMKKDNEHEIKLITSSLLSDLVDRGWPLETLFGWPNNFLNISSGYSFDDNLKFMLKILHQPRQEFEITLRISKCSSLPSITQYGSFLFSPDAGITESEDEATKKFITQFQSVCFAKTTVNDFDHRSAAINAREELEQLIDLLRFGFEPDRVLIENICHVKRLSDDKDEIVITSHVLPNPTDDIPYGDFASFSNDLDIVSRKTNIDIISQTQLQVTCPHKGYHLLS